MDARQPPVSDTRRCACTDARRAVDEVAAFIRYATTVQDEISA